MKCTFTVVQIGLLLAALEQVVGNKRLLIKKVKWEEVLTPTAEEIKRTGVVVLEGGLSIAPENRLRQIKRDLPLEALQLLQKAVNDCQTWRGGFAKEVIALCNKIDQLVTDEKAIVAWDKLPKKERERIKKEKEDDI